MKTIEQRLLEKGITKEQLTAFARMPKHNGKKDLFRFMFVRSWEDIDGDFRRAVLEVLADIGLEQFEEYSPDKNRGQFNYLGRDRYRLSVGASVANKMLGTLENAGRYQQYDETLTLDKLYDDTFGVKEVAIE